MLSEQLRHPGHEQPEQGGSPIHRVLLRVRLLHTTTPNINNNALLLYVNRHAGCPAFMLYVNRHGWTCLLPVLAMSLPVGANKFSNGLLRRSSAAVNHPMLVMVADSRVSR